MGQDWRNTMKLIANVMSWFEKVTALWIMNCERAFNCSLEKPSQCLCYSCFVSDVGWINECIQSINFKMEAWNTQSTQKSYEKV